MGNNQPTRETVLKTVKSIRARSDLMPKYLMIYTFSDVNKEEPEFIVEQKSSDLSFLVNMANAVLFLDANKMDTNKIMNISISREY